MKHRIKVEKKAKKMSAGTLVKKVNFYPFNCKFIIFTPFCWVKLKLNISLPLFVGSDVCIIIDTPICWVKYKDIFTPFNWVRFLTILYFYPSLSGQKIALLTL